MVFCPFFSCFSSQPHCSMEQTEGYKSVEERIRLLEQTLSQCSDAVEKCEKSGKEAAKEIEEQFAKCINALAARKAVLLKEVEARITKQSMPS